MGRSMRIRAGAVILGLLGCALTLRNRIAAGALLWAAAAAIWIMTSERKARTLKGKEDPIGLPEQLTPEKILRDIGNIDTPLGRPWLCKIMPIKRPGIVYGPDQNGVFIYGYCSHEEFILLSAERREILKPSDREIWRLSQTREAVAVAGNGTEGLLGEYRAFFKAYVESKGRGITQERAERIFRRPSH